MTRSSWTRCWSPSASPSSWSPSRMAFSLGIALLVNNTLLAGRNVFRTLFYLPIQIPLVASTLVWVGVLNTSTGWLNMGLGAFGIAGPDWLNSTTWVDPEPRADGPLGDRQHDADLPGGPPGRADRAVRRGQGGRRRAWRELPARHAAVAVAGALLQPDHQPISRSSTSPRRTSSATAAANRPRRPSSTTSICIDRRSPSSTWAMRPRLPGSSW